MRSMMCGGGVCPFRRNERRARSTGSPCAMTYPIAASISTTTVTLQLSDAFRCVVPTTVAYVRSVTWTSLWGVIVTTPQSERSVRRQGRVHGVDPGDDAALDVHGVLEAGRLEGRQRLGRAHTRLAVQDDLAVLREARQRLAGEDFALGDQGRARDPVDLPLGGLADVDQEQVLATVLPVLELTGGDRGVQRRLLGLGRDGAAEVLVVLEQVGDGRVLAAERAVRVLADLDLAVLHLQGVVDHQLADQRLTDAGQELDRLVDLDGSDRGAQHTQDTALGARRNHARRRRLRVEAAVARGVLH